MLPQIDKIAERAFHSRPDLQETQQLDIFRYVVDEALEGRESSSASILEFLELVPRKKKAEEKPPDDPTARAQMRFIRQKLEAYYREEGYNDGVEISIPTGRYTPIFSRRPNLLTKRQKRAMGRAQAASDIQSLPSAEEALLHIEEVLSSHPDLPDALIIKADAHIILALQGMPPKAELAEAEALAKRALILSPKYSLAHSVSGFVHSSCRRWADAARAFRRSRQFALPKAPVHFDYVAYLVSRGRLAEAIQLTESAMTMGYYGCPTQPLPVILTDLGFLYLLADDLEQAEATLEDGIHGAPQGFYMPYIYMAFVHEAKGDPQGGLDTLNRAPVKAEEAALLSGSRALMMGLAGEIEQARAELGALASARQSGHYIPPAQLLMAHVGTGDFAGAISDIRQMTQNHDPIIHWLGYCPFLRHIANDLQFGPIFRSVLVKEIRMKWHWRRRRFTAKLP